MVKDEKTARDVVAWRKENKANLEGQKSSASNLEDLLSQVKKEDQIDVSVIIKADTQGSLEALNDAILKLNTEKVTNKIVHKAVGGITAGDISLAEASGAVVIGFNVRASSKLSDEAEKSGVVVKYFSIIYEVIDALRNIMTGKLPPILKEVIIGHAQVRDPISVPKVGTIAGSAVTDGKITRQSKLRVIRDDVVLYAGELGSLRRFKDDVAEVSARLRMWYIYRRLSRHQRRRRNRSFYYRRTQG